MLQRFYSVARTTYFETIRQPIYGVIVLATAMLLVLNVSLAAFTLEDDDKLLLDLGLSTMLLSGLFLAAFSASGILGREIENKTVLTVISKPISRPVFFFAKYAGLMVALIIAFYLNFLVFALCQRHGVLANTSDPWDAPILVFGCTAGLLSLVLAGFSNYLYGKHFATTAITFAVPFLTLAVVLAGFWNATWERQPWVEGILSGQIVLASYLVMLTLLITAAIALAVSARLGQVMTLVFSTAALGLGIASDYAFGQHADESSLASAAYHTVPNFGAFWVIDGLQAATVETVVPPQYIVLATVYAALVTFAILSLGVVAFQRREVG